MDDIIVARLVVIVLPLFDESRWGTYGVLMVEHAFVLYILMLACIPGLDDVLKIDLFGQQGFVLGYAPLNLGKRIVRPWPE